MERTRKTIEKESLLMVSGAPAPKTIGIDSFSMVLEPALPKRKNTNIPCAIAPFWPQPAHPAGRPDFRVPKTAIFTVL